MQPSIIKKLEEIKNKADELSRQLAKAEIISDQNRFRELAKEYAAAAQVVTDFNEYTAMQKEAAQLEDILRHDKDEEVRELAKEEASELKERLELKERELLLKLLPV